MGDLTHKKAFFLLFSFVFVVFGAKGATNSEALLFTVTGKVLAAGSSEPLAYVTIRMEGTTLGTMSDELGNFTLSVPEGEHTLIFSIVGFRTEKRVVTNTTSPEELLVVMFPASLEAPEVVITTENPGVAIMRNAIQRKVDQTAAIQTYSYSLYTKFIAATDTLSAGRNSGRGDTTIVSIFESYSEGYYKAPDKYFNEIVQRRQSVNVPPEANFVAFGTNLNMYDDVVTILGEDIITPFHPNAIDYYDFKLVQWIIPDSLTRIAKVSFTPKSSQRKLFEGHLDIIGATGEPLDIVAVPNRAVQLPFDASLSYRQQFLEENGFIAPAGLTIFGSLDAELFWIIKARLDVTISTVAYNYAFNIPLDDNLFERRRVEIAEKATEFDSTFWNENAILKLASHEQYAYDAIKAARDNPDSLLGSNIFSQVFGGLSRFLGQFNRAPFTGFDDIVSYNSISGFTFGSGYMVDYSKNTSSVFKASYGFANTRLYGEGSLSHRFGDVGRYTFEANVFSKLARRDNPNVVSKRTISLLSLFFKNDYGDYYHTDGGELSFNIGFGQLDFIRRDLFARPSNIKFFVRNEYQTSATVSTNFAFFGKNQTFRANIPAKEGVLRSAGLYLGYNYTALRKYGNFGIYAEGEFTSQDVLGSDFSFEQYRAGFHVKTATLPLWTLSLQVDAGYSNGLIPPQKYFSLESSASSIAGSGRFRTMKVKEFYGDQFVTVYAEHNFGELIPGVLRIPNIASFGIEVIAIGNVGWSKFNPETLAYGGITLPTTETTSDNYFYEAGIGFNRIALFFRADITARLSQTSSPQFLFTISGATF